MLERIEKVLDEWVKTLREDWVNRRELWVVAVIFVTFLNLGIPAIIVYGVVVSPSFGQFLVSFCPEAVGIAFTAFVLNRLAKRREQAEREASLLRRTRGSVRDIAVGALDELRALGFLDPDNDTFVDAELRNVQWAGARLEKTNLQGTSLWYANLEGVHLRFANLQGAHLEYANLKEADLRLVNLQEAHLRQANLQGARLLGAKLQGANLLNATLEGASMRRANLQGAYLGETNLQRADLWGANLHGAKLWNTNLHEANLSETNLQGANLKNAQFNEETTLPDCTNWTSETDMARFTDPDHPDFWRSDDPQSPAYRGRREPDGE